jgi:hypothetical protein
VGLKPLSLEAGASQLEPDPVLALGEDTMKAAFHHGPQSDAFTCGELARLVQERVGDLNRRLHSPFHMGREIWVPISYDTSASWARS